MKPPAKERRRFPRRMAALPVEVRQAAQSYPLKCETTDISLGGCYVKTLFTLPVGTEVNLRIRLADTELQVKGAVRTADPGLGNGIEFLEMPPEQREQLARYLQNVFAGTEGGLRIIR